MGPNFPRSHKPAVISGPPTEAVNTARRPRAISSPPSRSPTPPPRRGLGQLSQGAFTPGGDPKALHRRSLAAKPLGEETQARDP